MGDVAVVIGVGASDGLGGALARRFAKGGMHVVISGRTQSKLDAIADEIKKDGGQATGIVGDTTVASDCENVFAQAAEIGPIKAVLYNAGNNWPIPFSELDAEKFEEFWRICCLGGFCAAHASLPYLEKSGGGTLLFTGASASMRGKPNFAHFAAAKAGLRAMAQALAKEYGPKNIHVGHVVVDGMINGDRLKTLVPEILEKAGPDGSLVPEDMAESFWQLHVQPRSTWTFEIDLRPYCETW